MPRTIDYPRKSFTACLKLAEATDYFSGETAAINVAEKMEMSVNGGSFQSLVGAAMKHGLVEKNKANLRTTGLFKTVKLAYNEDEKLQSLREAFLNPPVYRKIYEKYVNKEFPKQMLHKILIRELDVQEEIASRVANYFISGASFCQLLINNRLVEVKVELSQETEEIEETDNNVNKIAAAPSVLNGPSRFYGGGELVTAIQKEEVNTTTYIIHIYGNGIDTKLEINDDDDLTIVDATLNKVRKRLKEKNREEMNTNA